MSKAIVKIKDWPFPRGEKAKLTWIGEPFKENNKWMFYAYFKGNIATRKIMLDWASIHFLSVDKYYTDGNLNNGELLEEKDIIDINLKGVKAEYIEKDWGIWVRGFKDNTKSKTFNFYKKGTLYTIPIIEVIRVVLAPNRFMLNRILEMDTLENYFTYEIKDNKLDIHFTAQYDRKLLKSEKINHLAWLLTNEKVFRMLNSIGTNLWQLGELKLDFLLDNFNIRARVNRNGRNTRIVEIISLKKKKINVDMINIYHPSLEESRNTDEAKKRKYVGNNNKNNNRELDTEADGAAESSEEINTFQISHEYEIMPKINKLKSGRKIRRVKEDKNTKIYTLENGQARTVADVGGENMLMGLEFTNLSNVQEKGELEEFVEMLKLLEKRKDVKSVEIIIGELPEGKKGKRFAKLNDGVTKRKYAIGKIIMINDKVCSLIEIERENRLLSMLLLKGNILVKWKRIYSIILLSLVNESGKWSNATIKKLERMEIIINRIKHINNEIIERVNYIYKKL
ncbi:hypothetical protein GCM10008905_00700 [Clostridium malenominatum]|uniref:TnsE C-terminal domain-containing protein n=1 Tax=Clostridium malenominatum TaxID=1539 RepID=A0ABP3TTV0_9CLOT